MLRPSVVLLDLALVLALGGLGVLGAWLLRRRSTLSVKNLYLAAGLTGLALVLSVAVRAWSAAMVLAPTCAPARALPQVGVAAGAGQTLGGAQVHRVAGRDRSRTAVAR